VGYGVAAMGLDPDYESGCGYAEKHVRICMCLCPVSVPETEE